MNDQISEDGIASAPRQRGWLALCLCVFHAFTLPEALDAQTQAKLREPLPLDVVAGLRMHNEFSPIGFSPDGDWIAHVVITTDPLRMDTVGLAYTVTGFAAPGVYGRPEAMLTHTRTGEVVTLGGPTAASGSPVWAPDGRRVAFYSDEDGEAGLWIWERETRTSRRVPTIVVRQFWPFEAPRWTSDGRRVVVKALPPGVSVAEANASDVFAPRGRRFPEVAPGQPSVVVRRHLPGQASAEGEDAAADNAAPAGAMEGNAVDLVVVDVETGHASRVLERVPVHTFAWAPGDRFIGFTIRKGSAPRSEQQALYDIAIVDVETGRSRIVVTDAYMASGSEWSWAPDGESLAYIAGGPLSAGEIVIVPLDGAAKRVMPPAGAGRFASGFGVAPFWSSDGHTLYARTGGALWSVDARTGATRRVAEIPGWRITATIGVYGESTLWTTDGGRTAWVIGRSADGARAGILGVDLETGAARTVIEESTGVSPLPFAMSASSATGEIAYVASALRRPQDIWMYDTRVGHRRRATRINPDLERYELGAARVIEWTGPDGQRLRGALLLPPGYRAGQRVPLVVDIYAGRRGSSLVNTFGLDPNPPYNAHVLATRGYAVLYPDAPFREGHVADDVLAVVLSGVDAAIDQRFADPERVAITGHSFGAYNVLTVITRTTRFKAAITAAVVTHPDLFTDYLRGPGYWEHGQGQLGGTIWEHPERYFENSPIFRFDRIETPILIGHGEKDGDLQPTEAIFTALVRLGKPVEYRLYEGELHTIRRPEHVIDFWKRKLEFLDEYLGGLGVREQHTARASPAISTPSRPRQTELGGFTCALRRTHAGTGRSR